MLKMVDGTGIIGLDMVCPLGGAVSPPQPPNFDKIEMEGVGSLTLPNSLKAPLERVELIGNSVQGENPAPDNPQEIKSAGRFDEASRKYLLDVKVTGRNILSDVGDTYNVFVPCLIKAGAKVTLITNGMESAGGNIKLIRENKEIIWFPFDAGKTKTTKTIPVNIVGFINVLKPKDGLKYCLVIGDTDNYEPYTEQSVQIALNEPLRGIGEYKDTITKDGVARKIKQITVNEKSDLIFYTESKNTLAYLVKVPDATQTNYTYSTVSDRFVKTQYIDSNDTNGVVTLFGKQIIFRVSKEIANNIDALKEWLVDNNITFNYVLESPITEPLPESVQAQLSALHSENRVTHVFVDSGEVPCGIKLTYRKEK